MRAALPTEKLEQTPGARKLAQLQGPVSSLPAQVWSCPTARRAASPPPPGDTHSLRIGAVWAERQGERWSEYPQLPHHLLHTTEGPLLICVSKLHH